MVAFLGRLRIKSSGWDGRNTVFVSFESHYDDRVVQLYAGRTLIGVTNDPTETRVVGQLVPSESPTPLTLLAVLLADQFTDFGPDLPRVPWNRYELGIDATDYVADDAVSKFELSQSPAAGEALDATNIIANVPYIGARQYLYRLPPLPTSGEWEFGTTPYDDAKPDGNPGTLTTTTINALIAPPDFTLDRNGNRFGVEVVDGTAEFEFTLP